MATNKVVYGNTTLIDLTGDTAEASDVASGKIFHNKAGVQQTGTGTIVTPTSITPSNSSPASMSANGIYKPTASGYAISSYSSVAPSNSSPPSLSNGSIYKPSANGYAISSYSSITPSSSGAYFSSGMVKMSSSGYAYSSQPSTPTCYIFDGKISQYYPSGSYLQCSLRNTLSNNKWLMYYTYWRNASNSFEGCGIIYFSSGGSYKLQARKTDGSYITDLTVDIYSTSVKATKYSGSWYDIYITLYDVTDYAD